MKVLNVSKPLMYLKGSGLGMLLEFSQDSLQFGMVRINGRQRLKTMLMNKGDIDTRYYWLPITNECFSVTPAEGFIGARSNVTFTITFHPTYKNPYIKCHLKCSFDNYHSLAMPVYGSCMDLSDFDVKTTTFRCPVRETDTAQINITNNSDAMWTVVPFLIGNDFRVVKEFSVEPKSVYNLQVKYLPRFMGEHRGQLLLSPLGESSLLFNLMGQASIPNPNAMFELTIACKQPYTEKLEVNSLCEKSQTYITRAEVLKITPDNRNIHYDIKMPRVIKVWGETTAVCAFTITCYGECVMRVKVCFVNVDTKEFQYYLMVINVGPSPIEDTIDMVVKAREKVDKTITVRNPHFLAAKFSAYCANLDVIAPEEISVNARSEEKVTISYAPFVVGEQIDFLEVGNQTIGLSLYKLHLTCLPPTVKKLTFSTSLGCRIPMYFKITNRVNKPVDFICNTTNSSFIAERSYTVPALDKKKLVVYFEPIDLGQLSGMVTFDSPIAGEFSYEIIGLCSVPKPRGPIDVRIGSSAQLAFKNVFDDTRTFRIYTDNPAFTIKNHYETVKGKQELKIQVQLSTSSGASVTDAPSKGTLTIECFDPSEPKVAWTYFLQGAKLF